MQNDFVRFMERMNENGFNPELSAVELAKEPILWIINGTHRLGYMLNQQPNFFIPAKFIPEAPWGITNGPTYLRGLGLPENMLNELLQAYYEIYSKMRRTLAGVIDAELFDKQGEKIIEEFLEHGKMYFAGAKKTTLPMKDSPWREKLPIKTHEAVMLTLRIEKESLYIREGEIYSYEVDSLSKHLSELFGENWGYIAHTITESILLEEYLHSTHTGGSENKNP